MKRQLERYDVVVIGLGPVGRVVAMLLARKGHRVAAFERWSGVYPLPRACVVDGETMSLFQEIGIARAFEPFAVPTHSYSWWNGEGELLLSITRSNEEMAGWRARYMMYQPDLERLLDDAARATPGLGLNHGWQAVGLTQDAHHATVEVESFGAGPACRRHVQARYVIGADGANSFARVNAGVGWEDLGFQAEWLVVDFKPNDPDVEIDMPLAGQLCDPARPISLFRRLGPEHCRWEVMLLPGEEPAQMEHPDAVWGLLSRWITPADGTLVRSTVYTFRSCLAERWRDGRVLLAGDAAHLMPPFLGQGMCSGLRDAAGIAWRLDLILRGVSDDALLDSYEVERKAHTRSIIEQAVSLGRILCELDPERAKARDRAILSGGRPPLPPFPHLVGGCIAAGTPLAGQIAPQFLAAQSRREGLFYDIFGKGWHVVACTPGLVDALPQRLVEACRAIGMTFVELAAPGEGNGGPVDSEGRYAELLASAGAQALILRPDGYVFGTAPSADALQARLADLLTALHAVSAGTPMRMENVA